MEGFEVYFGDGVLGQSIKDGNIVIISMENPYTKMQIQHQYNLARDNNASSK